VHYGRDINRHCITCNIPEVNREKLVSITLWIKHAKRNTILESFVPSLLKNMRDKNHKSKRPRYRDSHIIIIIIITTIIIGRYGGQVTTEPNRIMNQFD